MTMPLRSLCMTCHWWIDFEPVPPKGRAQLADDFRYKCAAFPRGIPIAVYTWEKPHTAPVKGQTGDHVWNLDRLKSGMDEYEIEGLRRRAQDAESRAGG